MVHKFLMDIGIWYEEPQQPVQLQTSLSSLYAGGGVPWGRPGRLHEPSHSSVQAGLEER